MGCLPNQETSPLYLHPQPLSEAQHYHREAPSTEFDQNQSSPHAESFSNSMEPLDVIPFLTLSSPLAPQKSTSHSSWC